MSVFCETSRQLNVLLFLRSILQHCHKIGEGVYGEVFLLRNGNGGTSVMKIIPIEGTLIVNGDRQKKFEEILSEMIIAMLVLLKYFYLSLL